jgi:lysophospholipase L1-like esterase
MNKKAILFLAFSMLFIGWTIDQRPGFYRKIWKIIRPVHTTVFLGNSLTAWFDLYPFERNGLMNFGIPGNLTSDVYARLDTIIKIKPEMIFLEIGINDLIRHKKPEEVIFIYDKILDKLVSETGETEIFVQSIFPVATRVGGQLNKDISKTNRGIRALCNKYHLPYVDVYSRLAGTNNALQENYTKDGLHLTDEGYKIWREVLEPLL